MSGLLFVILEAIIARIFTLLAFLFSSLLSDLLLHALFVTRAWLFVLRPLDGIFEWRGRGPRWTATEDVLAVVCGEDELWLDLDDSSLNLTDYCTWNLTDLLLIDNDANYHRNNDNEEHTDN